MNAFEYNNFERCQQLMANMLTNESGENYIVATDDENLISQYSKFFRHDGYVVEVIDLINPTASTISFDELRQIQSVRDAKWFADQLEAPWLQDDPYWHTRASALIASFIRILKHTDLNACISALVKIMDDLYLGLARDEKAPSYIEKLIADIISVDPHCDLVNDLEVFAKLPRETLKVICKHSSRILHYYFRYSDSSAAKCLSAFDTRTFLENKTVLFVKTDPNCIEQNNCARLITKSLYCQAYELESPTLPIKTNFICGSYIF